MVFMVWRSKFTAKPSLRIPPQLNKIVYYVVVLDYMNHLSVSMW